MNSVPGTSNILSSSVIIIGFLIAVYLLLWLCILTIRKITGYHSATTDNISLMDIAAPEKDLRAKVAAAAIAVVLEMENETVPHEFPLPPTALVSAWQAVKRADILKRHGGRPR